MPSSGSEFWFVLSFERGVDSWLAAPEMTKLPVLIADDNPIAREALHGIVDSLGWQATTVTGRRRYVTQAKLGCTRNLGNSLLLDYKMPGMDGLTAARAIRHDLKEADAPIIIMVTAFSSNQLFDHPDSQLADAIQQAGYPRHCTTRWHAPCAYAAEKHRHRSRRLRLVDLRILVVDDSRSIVSRPAHLWAKAPR